MRNRPYTIFNVDHFFTQYHPKEDELSSSDSEVVPDSQSDDRGYYPYILQGLIPAVLTPQEGTSGKWPYLTLPQIFSPG